MSFTAMGISDFEEDEILHTAPTEKEVIDWLYLNIQNEYSLIKNHIEDRHTFDVVWEGGECVAWIAVYEDDEPTDEEKRQAQDEHYRTELAGDNEKSKEIDPKFLGEIA